MQRTGFSAHYLNTGSKVSHGFLYFSFYCCLLHKKVIHICFVFTQSALPAAAFIMDKAQWGGADGERARRKPGQQTQSALLTAAIIVRIGLIPVLVVVLGGFCFRENIFSSEMKVAAARVWAKGQSASYFSLPLPTDSD